MSNPYPPQGGVPPNDGSHPVPPQPNAAQNHFQDAERHQNAVYSEAQAEVRAEEESLGELFSSLTRNTSTLIQQEIALAKAELRDDAKKAGAGAGMMAGAALAGFFVLLFLSTALWHALGHLVGLGWSAVIVAVVWGIIAAILFAVGKKNLEKMKGVPQTVDTAKELPDTFNPSKETP